MSCPLVAFASEIKEASKYLQIAYDRLRSFNDSLKSLQENPDANVSNSQSVANELANSCAHAIQRMKKLNPMLPRLQYTDRFKIDTAMNELPQLKKNASAQTSIWEGIKVSGEPFKISEPLNSLMEDCQQHLDEALKVLSRLEKPFFPKPRLRTFPIACSRLCGICGILLLSATIIFGFQRSHSLVVDIFLKNWPTKPDKMHSKSPGEVVPTKNTIGAFLFSKIYQFFPNISFFQSCRRGPPNETLQHADDDKETRSDAKDPRGGQSELE